MTTTSSHFSEFFAPSCRAASGKLIHWKTSRWKIPLFSFCLASVAAAGEFNGFTYEFADEDELTVYIAGYPKDAVGAISIPASIEGKPVVFIGEEAFSQCDFLTSVTIPASVTRIATDAFSGCDALANVTIPEGVVEIENFAFFDCLSLPSVTIPASITSLANSAFGNCPSLTKAYFIGNAPSMGDTVFDPPASNPALTIYYFDGKSGFATPFWTVGLIGYATVNMGTSAPFSVWLIEQELPSNSGLLDDSDGDGVTLLMAYALNLDPNQNLSGSLPQAVFGANQMSLSFYAGRFGVTYLVKTSYNLTDWTDTGVTLTEPDANQIRTATVNFSGPAKFMRLEVSN